MRVLLTHPSADLYGSDRMAAEAVIALREAGHEVSVALPASGPLVDLLHTSGAQVHVADIPVLRKTDMRPVGLVRLAGRLLRSIGTMRQIMAAAQPDVLYVNTIAQPWWTVLGRLARVPVLTHVRENESQLPRVVRIGLLSPLLLATSVVSNSKATMGEIARTLPVLDKKRLSVIYNGKDWTPYGVDRVLEPRTHEGFSLVVVGRLSPRKGQDVVLQALGELTRLGKDVRVNLVGDVFPGYEWFEADLREMANDLGVSDRVTFSGFAKDIRPHLAAADMAVVPSRIEPFGTVAAESMAAGVLTVVAEVQGLTEIVTHQETGLTFPSEDAATLVLRCLWAMENPEAAHRLAASGRASVVSRFTVGQYRAAIVEAVQSLS
ncbi:MAG TPA: glycosyltransferase [Propionibacterium sp.]|nr:glycosyltransferase [Propionibacterium sp.]